MRAIWKLLANMLIGATMLAGAVAQAAIPVAIPSSGSGSWSDGLGSSIDFGGDTLLSVSSGTSFGLTFGALDCCVVGDAFGLILDGSATAWTTSGFTGAGGLFEGYYTGVLGAGVHTLGLVVTADCCGSGGMDWTLVAAPVPEPETYAMLLAGLGLLGFVARRRQRKLAVA